MEYTIDLPFTILSNNKSNTVAIAQHQIATDFNYLSIPKIKESAFLIGYLKDWQKLNLMDGEANLFLENTFVGKTALMVGSVEDELSINFGNDKNVVVRRKRNLDYSKKKSIGANKEVNVGWDIDIKNNKNNPIKITVKDQYPIASNNSVSIEQKNKSGAKLDNQTNELTWELTIAPNELKTLKTEYIVKHPKNWNIDIQ